MTQKDVAYFLHQCRVRSCPAVIGIQDYQFHAVRQCASATRPSVSCGSQQMFSSTFAEIVYLIEVNDDEICEAGEFKRIEWEVWFDAGEVTQGEGFQLEGTPFFAWR